MNNFEGDTADDVWRQAAQSLLSGDKAKTQDSRDGPTIELLHSNLYVRNPRERWAFSRQPGMNPAFAIAEVFWILSGRNDAKFVNFWNPELPKYAADVGAETYHGAYGYRIRKQFGIDQLERALLALRGRPTSRQVVIQLWDPRSDFPTEDGSEVSKDVPCNICSMLKVRDGRLEWTQIMRSNDIFRGLPHNFVQFTMLQEILAGWLEVEVGAYHHVSDSLHVYEKALDEGFGISPQQESVSNTDSVNLPKDISDGIIKNVMDSLEKLSQDGLQVEGFKHICMTGELPVGYRNLLLIAAAESARRRRWPDEMEYAASQCSNPALSMLWNNWKCRWETAH